jgi:hypothetical protein
MLPLAEELWDGLLWDLPFKLQSSVCYASTSGRVVGRIALGSSLQASVFCMLP